MEASRTALREIASGIGAIGLGTFRRALKPTTRWLAGVLFCGALLGQAGCIAISLPPFEYMEEGAPESIELGVTTREEVRRLLGKPDLLESERFEAYCAHQSAGSLLVLAEGAALVPIAGTIYCVVVEYRAGVATWVGTDASGWKDEDKASEFEPAREELSKPRKGFMLARRSGLVTPPGRTAPLAFAHYSKMFSHPEIEVVDPIVVTPVQLDLETAGVRSRDDIEAIGWSSGRVLVGVGTKSGAGVWDARSGALVARLEAKRRGGLQMVFDRSGSLIATYGLGPRRELRVWEATTGEVRFSLEGARRDVWSLLAFTPDGRSLVGRARSGLAFIDSRTGEVTVDERMGKFGSMVYSPRGDRVAFARRGVVEIWRTSRGGLLGEREMVLPREIWAGTASVGVSPRFSSGVCFSPGGRRLAMFADGEAAIWDLVSRRRIATVPGVIGGAAFESDSSLISMGQGTVERVRLP